MDFTYYSYQNMLTQINSSGEYQFCGYDNYNDVINPCILRHDVDFDLHKAVIFAELEAKMGVKATYFILLNTNFYNVFSTQNRRLLKKIQDCGHEIGLHFDEMQYEIEENWELLCEKIIEESEMLSAILKTPIKTVSMHRPSKGLLEANIKIPGILNSYQYLFFREFKYFSDSRMFWREDVMAGINKERYPKLHILTHPFWYEEKKGSLESRLSVFLNQAKKERYECLNLNFRELSSVIKI